MKMFPGLIVTNLPDLYQSVKYTKYMEEAHNNTSMYLQGVQRKRHC